MKQKLIILISCMTFLTLWVMPIGQPTPKVLAQDVQSQPSPQQVNTQYQPNYSRRYQSSRERRSYERETHTRRHYHITKGEIVTLATVAAVPMGIGAVAAGGRGLAIGAIVAGPSTVAAHYIWKHFHR
ncbi:MAG: hypothetical protein ACYDA9_00215 [Terriglobia bacterium]